MLFLLCFTLSALDGVCHQNPNPYAFDIGAPTYFRQSISEDGGTGKKNDN